MNIGFPWVSQLFPYEQMRQRAAKAGSERSTHIQHFSVTDGKDGFRRQHSGISQGIRFGAIQPERHVDDEQLVNQFSPLIQQVMVKARNMAAEGGEVEIKPAHLLGAMVGLLDELTQWQVPAGRHARTLSREQREAAVQLAEMLIPGSGQHPDEVARQLRPLLTRLHPDGDISPRQMLPTQMRLHPATRQAMMTALQADPDRAIQGKALVAEVLQQDRNSLLEGVPSATRQHLEASHRLLSSSPDIDMDTDLESTVAPDLLDELKEKSPTLHKWVELGSGHPKDRYFDQFQPAPLSSIVAKGLDMAIREVNVNRKQRGGPKNAQIGRNLESLNALVPPEQRKKLDKVHLLTVLTNAQRKLTALPKPANEAGTALAAANTRMVLANFLAEPGRADFSVNAFVQSLRNQGLLEEAANSDEPSLEVDHVNTGRVLAGLAEEVQDKRLQMMEQFEKTCPTLMKNGINLVRAGLQNQLPDVLMRREATDRMLAMVNSGATRTNLLLNASSGEGKTYAVLGLAQRFANDDVPKSMQGTQMVQLDLGRVLGNAQFRGEVEKVSKEIFDQLNRYLTDNPKRKVIVFMDKINLLGSDDGALLLDSMKSSGILEKKNLTFIGATTPEDWRQASLRKDQAFLGCFHNLHLPPFSAEEKLAILGRSALAAQQEMGVEIPPDQLEKILKQASAKWPENVLRQADDLMRLAAFLTKIAPLEQSVLKDLLQRKEQRLGYLQQNNQTIKGRFVREMNQTSREIAALTKEIQNVDSSPVKQDRAVLKDKHVRQALAILTGEKIGVLSQDELTRLHQAKEILSQYIVGQPEALTMIEDGLREIAVRQKTGDVQDKPIVSMLLPGPTGVGKTEVAKVIAKEFMNGNFIRVDMSDYMEKGSTSRMTGTSPGYVGYENGGLVDEIRKKPQSVIVFDEIEKAHEDVFNLLLQILGEGELRDNQNQPVSFRNAIVVLTSNLNNQQITEKVRQYRKGLGETGKDPQLAARELETQVRSLLTKNANTGRVGFKPEQLGRIDYVIPFSPLTRRNVSEILDIRLKEMNQTSFLKDNNLEIHLSDKARQRLVNLTAASAQPDEDADSLMRLGSLRVSDDNEELSLQGGARDVSSNFNRFVKKKVFTDLTYDPRLVDLENARITVDYDPSSQQFLLKPSPLAAEDNTVSYTDWARKGGSRTLGIA